jgi:tetratricopeptide (TPR) repeat protein
MVELITEAEKILLDADKRAAYDTELAGTKETKQVDIPEGEKDWLETTWRYYEESDWELARSSARKATSQQSKNVIAWYLAGEIYRELKDYENANEAAYEAILLDEENPYAYGLRGDVYLLQKNNEPKALEQYEKMKVKSDNYPDAYQYAVEHIAWLNGQRIANRLISINVSASVDVDFNENGLNKLRKEQSRLREALSTLKKGSSEVHEVYEKVNSPTNWAQKIFNDFFLSIDRRIENCEGSIQTCQRKINELEEYVINWGRAKNGIIAGIVLTLISLCGLSATPSAFFGVLVGIGIAVTGVAVNRKPKWQQYGR